MMSILKKERDEEELYVLHQMLRNVLRLTVGRRCVGVATRCIARAVIVLVDKVHVVLMLLVATAVDVLAVVGDYVVHNTNLI